MMYEVTSADDPVFYFAVDSWVNISWLDTKQHLAGKRGLVTGAAFAFGML
jgi:hypothetical protein